MTINLQTSKCLKVCNTNGFACLTINLNIVLIMLMVYTCETSHILDQVHVQVTLTSCFIVNNTELKTHTSQKKGHYIIMTDQRPEDIVTKF